MIDVHTHLWPIENSPAYMTAYFEKKKLDGEEILLTGEELLDSMEKNGIRKVIVHALAFDGKARNRELEKQHRYIEQQVRASAGRMAAFCTVQPFETDGLHRLECYMERGFAGLKLHPNIQRFYIDDQRLYPMYQWLSERKRPIMFHTGGIGLHGIRDCYGDVKRVDNVACEFPELPVIMGHAGRIHYDETAEILRKHPNVYADISTNFGRLPGKEWLQTAKLAETVKLWSGTTEKLLFGSDHPFYSQSMTVTYTQRLRESIVDDGILDRADIDGILYANAESFCEKYHIF